MAKKRSAKAGQQRYGGGGSGRRSGGSSRAPLSVGLKKQQPNLLCDVSEGQSFARFSDLTLMAFLAVAAALPYLNTLGNGFAGDDEMQVLRNPYIRNFHYLGKIFTTPVMSYLQVGPNYYRPLMNVGYLLCYQVFGPHPFGFHLANLILHVVVVGAVFLSTKWLFQNRDLALTAAALFALHPIHSEAVASVAVSTDLELSLFYLLTFWLFLAEARPGGGCSYFVQLAMTASFVLAIGSKEQAVTLPVLATVYEHCYRADHGETRPAQKFLRYLPLWLLTVAYLLFRIRVLGALSSGLHIFHLTWYQTFLSALALLGQYLWKFLWPLDLRAFCPFHAPLSLFDPGVIGGFTGLTLCSALFFYLWRHARLLSFGLLWMLVTLAPVLNARWMPLDAFAERYLYLPSVGICWLLGWGLLRLRARASARGANWSRALAGACGILVALCLLRIVTRNRDWRNSFTLFSNTLASCPDAYYIRRYLGASYWLIGDIDSAEQEWRKTLEVAPHDSLTISNLGLVCLKKRRYSEATELFKKALGFDPSNEDAHLYLGLIYMERHWLELAEPELRAAVSLSPQNLEARNRLGMLYLNTGRLEEAEEQFRLSIKTQPNDSGYSNLGEIYLRRGDPGSAERAFQSATSLNPNNSQAHFKLGALYLSEGRKAEALREYQEGLKGNPENRDALAVLQKLSAQAGEK